MIKSASKFFFALAAFGLASAVGYSAATGPTDRGMDTILGPLTFGYKGYVGDHVGYGLLMGLAVAALTVGIVLSALRDADPEAEAEVLDLDVVPDAMVPVAANWWPAVGGFSLALVALGLAVDTAFVVLGMVGLAVTAVEWAARTWADRATADPDVNRGIRNRFMFPIEIPVGAALFVGLLVLAVSRILLALPKIGSYLVFGLVPAVVLGIGVLLVARPKLSHSLVAGLMVLGAVGVLGGGIVAAVVGEREHHDEEHHDEDHSEGDEEHEGLAPLVTLPVQGAGA